MPFDTRLQTMTTEIAPIAPNASDILCLLVSSRGALYGIEAARVREIHALPAIRPLPRAPRFVAGMVNVRGEIVPVIDLATRLGQMPRPPRSSDGLVLLQVEAPQIESKQVEAWQVESKHVEARQIALRVEEVCDIVSFPRAHIKGAPFGFEYSIVSGTTHRNGDIVLLLDISQLLESETAFEALNEADANAASANATDAAEVFWPDEDVTPIEDATQAVFRARAERLAIVPYATADGDAPHQSSMSLAPTSLVENASGASASPSAIARVVLGGEERGVVLTQVREFCALENCTPVPCCPPHILGQMNLRGEIVTLLDIAPQLGLTSQLRDGSNDQFPSGQVVVVKVATAREESGLVGIVVEQVGDVLLLRPDEMRDVAASSRAADKLCGAVLHDDKWIPVLNLPTLLSEASLIVDEIV